MKTCRKFIRADIGASNLKKGLFFSPDPYVKFKVSPRSHPAAHHGQHCRTEVRRNTVDPSWDRNVSAEGRWRTTLSPHIHSYLLMHEFLW